MHYQSLSIPKLLKFVNVSKKINSSQLKDTPTTKLTLTLAVFQQKLEVNS